VLKAFQLCPHAVRQDRDVAAAVPREFTLPFKKFYDRHTPDVPMDQLETWFHHEFRQSQASVIEVPHARAFLEFCRAQGLRTFLLSTVHGDYFAAQCLVTASTSSSTGLQPTSGTSAKKSTSCSARTT